MRKITGLFLIAVLVAISVVIYAPGKTQAQAAWNCNLAYSTGALVTYNGSVYKALLNIPAGECGWIPNVAPTVWQLQGSAATNTTGPTVAPTKTNTPGGPTATKTNTPMNTNTPTFVPTTGGGSACTAPNYNPAGVYVANDVVYYNGHQWKAKWWTQGEVPSTGGTGVWIDLGPCTGGSSPTPTIAGAGKGTNWSAARIFAPYVDVMAYPTFQLQTTTTNTGIKYYSLAFVIDGGSCTAKWGGVTDMSQNFLVSDIAGVRAMGGDVIISFGGANGTELAQACTSVSALQAQYQNVINIYSLTAIDFDVEGAAVTDHASIDRRNQAVAGLEAAAKSAGKTLRVSYTLPVMPTGLTADGLYVAQSAVNNNATVNVYNGMAMDYGAVANPNTMGANANNAAQSIFNQIKPLYSSKTTAQLWAMVGITPMIGMNDVSPEVFTLADANTVLSFAQTNGIAEIAFWSAGRDQQCSGSNVVSPSCSGVTQSQWAFSNILKAYK